MARLANPNARLEGTAISSMEAGTFFNFPVNSKGNAGVCVRTKDSAAGKNRFVNLHSGKVLKAVDDTTDRGAILPAGYTLRLS
jgi:hypothetical protein